MPIYAQQPHMTDFESELQRRGYLVYTNVGVSMMPLLRQRRDLVMIRRITGPLKKNDAVLFLRPDGAYVLHRIVRVCGDGKYRIAGDNCIGSELVPEERIIGILTEVIRDGRHIPVGSREYRRYLKSVPWRRCRLKLRHLRGIVKRKISAVCRKSRHAE